MCSYGKPKRRPPPGGLLELEWRREGLVPAAAVAAAFAAAVLRAAAAAPLHGALERAPRRELRNGRRSDLHALARARVHALARGTIRGRELPETGEVDLTAPTERVGDRVQHGVDGLLRVAAREPGF